MARGLGPSGFSFEPSSASAAPKCRRSAGRSCPGSYAPSLRVAALASATASKIALSGTGLTRLRSDMQRSATSSVASQHRHGIRTEYLDLGNLRFEFGQCALHRFIVDVPGQVDEEGVFPLGVMRRARFDPVHADAVACERAQRLEQ